MALQLITVREAIRDAIAEEMRKNESVFVIGEEVGEYEGAYLTFPRYKVAIDAPDNSVIIADSLELHGVSPIRGEGTRYTCVAYCDRRLATIGQLGKTPKKIGKYSDGANLGEFL